MAIDIKSIPSARSSAPQPQKESFLNKDIKLSGSGLNDKKKERLFSELGILLDAGVDLRTGLQLIVAGQDKAKDQARVQRILDRVVAGAGLSGAIQAEDGFTPYEYHSLRIGEETGKMAHVLQQLAAHYQRRIKQRAQLTSALTYPVIVLVVAVGAVYFMLQYVVPMFADIFARFDSELPWITKSVMAASDFMGAWFPLIALAIGSIAVLVYWQRNHPAVKKAVGQLTLRLPLIGPLVKTAQLAHFSSTMQLLLSSSTALVEAIALVRDMTSFYPMKQALSTIESDIIKGELLNRSMKQIDLFPSQMTTLIEVGEEVNQLDTIFEKLATQYHHEVDQKSATLSSVLEPIMIIVVAVLVAVILMAMYLPMFKLSTTIG